MGKAYCPKCRQNTNHKSLFKKDTGSVGPQVDFHWSEIFEIIECAGCENIQFKKTYNDESMEAYSSDGEGVISYDEIICYPFSLKNHNKLHYLWGLPVKIRAIYEETLEAFKAKSYILTGAGFRAIIEAVCIDKGINGDLKQMIDNLLNKKFITEKERNRLHSIRFIGNDSIHEGVKPDEKTLFIVLEIVEHLLNNLYLIDSNAEDHLETIINDYNKFEELVRMKCNHLNNKEKITIKTVLGKAARRLDNKKMIKFIQKLIARIKKSEVKWLTVNKIVSPESELYSKQIFEVNKK